MATVDIELSSVDTRQYIQTTRPACRPSLLDVHHRGVTYRLDILGASLHESHLAGARTPDEHAHDVYHIVCYMAGKGDFSLAGHTHVATTGALVMITPGQPHTFQPSHGHVVYHAITFALTAADGRPLRWPLHTLLAHYTGRQPPPPHEPILHLKDTAFAAMKNEIETCVDGLLRVPISWMDTALQLLHVFATLTQSWQTVQLAESAHDLDIRARNYIAAHYASPDLSIKLMAEALHVSPEHMCRNFRAQTGYSPMEYRNRLRLRAARNLLCTTNLPCKEIANRLGYSDLYAFSKAYRRMTGHPPSAERVQRPATRT